MLNGGAGDDILALLDPAFLEGFGAGGGRMLGGTGSDTLRLDGSGVSLDLGAIPDTRLTAAVWRRPRSRGREG